MVMRKYAKDYLRKVKFGPAIFLLIIGVNFLIALLMVGYPPLIISLT